jgi:hypothetical protein
MGKFALYVGINEYGGTNNLRGAVNDANLHRNVFMLSGEKSQNVRMLLDKQGTKARILQGLQWLVTDRDEEDLLHFMFSGHGSWTLPPHGLGWEACICCFDCGHHWDNGVLPNTELNAAIAHARHNLIVLLDSCFSGGMSPLHRPRPRLSSKVRKLLYGTDATERQARRALAGPEWVTIHAATTRLKLSRKRILDRISEGTMEARNVRGGPTYVLLRES